MAKATVASKSKKAFKYKGKNIRLSAEDHDIVSAFCINNNLIMTKWAGNMLKEAVRLKKIV
jgi:hypothetical protein